MRSLEGRVLLSLLIERGNEQGCANDAGLVLFDGEFGARGWGEAVCIVFAEGVGVFLLECDGYTGAPGTAGVASVCEGL